MSENSFKISGPSAIRYLDSEEALLADKLDSIVHHVVVTMVLYGCFPFRRCGNIMMVLVQWSCLF
jgi:hypothetical protein